MAERRKSQMQTLGANNEYGVTGMVMIIIQNIFIDFFFVVNLYIFFLL